MSVHFLKTKSGDCRFPLWDDPADEMLVCGEPAQEGSSFCPACHRRVYVRAPAMRRLPGDGSVMASRGGNDETADLCEELA